MSGSPFQGLRALRRLRDDPLKGPQFAVLVAAVARTDARTGRVRASEKQLAADAGVSLRTVIRVLQTVGQDYLVTMPAGRGNDLTWRPGIGDSLSPATGDSVSTTGDSLSTTGDSQSLTGDTESLTGDTESPPLLPSGESLSSSSGPSSESEPGRAEEDEENLSRRDPGLAQALARYGLSRDEFAAFVEWENARRAAKGRDPIEAPIRWLVRADDVSAPVAKWREQVAEEERRARRQVAEEEKQARRLCVDRFDVLTDSRRNGASTAATREALLAGRITEAEAYDAHPFDRERLAWAVNEYSLVAYDTWQTAVDWLADHGDTVRLATDTGEVMLAPSADHVLHRDDSAAEPEEEAG